MGLMGLVEFQMKVWTLMIQRNLMIPDDPSYSLDLDNPKSTVIPPSPMVLLFYVCSPYRCICNHNGSRSWPLGQELLVLRDDAVYKEAKVFAANPFCSPRRAKPNSRSGILTMMVTDTQHLHSPLFSLWVPEDSES